MASHPRNSIPACLLLTLFLTIRLTQAETFQSTDGPNDEEVKRKCGFSLKAIHDCKYQKCQEASAICAAMTPAAEVSDLTDCQIKHCMQEKKKCEGPLNKYLSEEEVCEGNEFNDVEMDCLLKLRTSLEQLTVCKRDGYLNKKVYCFQNEWKRRIGAYATDELRKTATPEAIDCAYNTCFQNVTRCLHDHHHDMAINPASLRRFDLVHCAYVAINYSHECESIPRLSGCAEKLATCIIKHPVKPDFTVVAIVGALVVVVVIIVAVVKRKYIAKKLRNCRGGSNNTQGSSNVAQSSSNVAQGSSNVAQGSTNVAQGSSNVAQGSSNVAQGSTNVAQGSSNVAQGSTNVAQGSSNVAQGSSNVAQGSTNANVQDIDVPDPTAAELNDEGSKLLQKQVTA